VNRKQAAEFIKKISGAYPNLEFNENRIKIWVEMMADIDYSLAVTRLKKHITTSKFPPSIAEILNPDEANRRGQRVEDQPTSPAGIMAGGYEIYDPAKH